MLHSLFSGERSYLERWSVSYIVKIITIALLALSGCVSDSFEKNNIPDKIGGDSGTLILNYENRVRNYDESIIDSHMRIYIEIEKPYIVSIPRLKDMDKIYSIPIEGAVVYRVQISNKGSILSSEKVLSGGLGLDEIADDIFKQVKIGQAWLAGKPGNSAAHVKILFRADRQQ